MSKQSAATAADGEDAPEAALVMDLVEHSNGAISSTMCFGACWGSTGLVRRCRRGR